MNSHSGTVLLGTRKGLFVFERDSGAAGGWRPRAPSFSGLQVPTVLADPRDGAWYAGVQHGHFGAKIHRSRDRGATWTELPAPAFPPKPDDAPEVKCPMRGTLVPWTVEQLWCLAAGGTDQPGRLWCGTIPGALFRSDDAGQSWELNRPLWDRPERAKWFGGGYDYPGIHSLCVDPRNSRRLGAAVSCGGYWVTEDDGANWSNRSTGMRAAYMPPEKAGDPDIQDPHCLVHCPGAPDALWAQHHNGIFRSTNGGLAWTEITNVEPSTFGFTVAVHPRDPETAWFVPAARDEERVPKDGRFVLTRTRDGGKSFQILSRGLPAEPAYDLVYRHALDIDNAGTGLVVGSTTGSAWTSDDGGDSWTVLSHHLPPVWIARFSPGSAGISAGVSDPHKS